MDYKPDSAGLGRYLLESTDLRRELQRRGELGIAAYRFTARKRTGDNAADIRYETRRGGKRSDRLVGAIVAFSTHAVAREFGTAAGKGRPAVPGEHNLARAIPIIERG